MRSRREALVLGALRSIQRRKNRAVSADEVAGELATTRHDDIHTEATLRRLVERGDVVLGVEPATYITAR